MEHLTQDRLNNCGQTCIAMVSNRSIRDIKNMVGHDSGMDIEKVIPVCNHLKISIGGKWVMKIWRKWIGRYLLPFNCFVCVQYKYQNEIFSHLIVRNKGKFLDPNGKQYYCFLKYHVVKAYLKIK